MLDYFLRFIAGGVAVSMFAALGDTLQPKSFAGLFGAAPSIALAALLITLSQNGASFAAVEGRSMIAGAFALAAYSWAVCVLNYEDEPGRRSLSRDEARRIAANMSKLPEFLNKRLGRFIARSRRSDFGGPHPGPRNLQKLALAHACGLYRSVRGLALARTQPARRAQ